MGAHHLSARRPVALPMDLCGQTRQCRLHESDNRRLRPPDHTVAHAAAPLSETSTGPGHPLCLAPVGDLRALGVRTSGWADAPLYAPVPAFPGATPRWVGWRRAGGGGGHQALPRPPDPGRGPPARTSTLALCCNPRGPAVPLICLDSRPTRARIFAAVPLCPR